MTDHEPEWEVFVQDPDEDPPGPGWEPFAAATADVCQNRDGSWYTSSIIYWRRLRETSND